MKDREFRELQVSSTQLAIIFFGILIIGVVIFLLGVSVGKKHGQAASKTAAALAQKAPDQVRDRLIVPESRPGTPAAEPARSEPEAKPVEAPAKPAEAPSRAEPGASPEVKPAVPETRPAPAVSKPEAPAETARPVSDAEPAAAPKPGYYYVQVGALAERSEAAAVARKFRSQGFSVVVLDPQPNDRKSVYRVRIGGFASRPEASAALAKLAAASSRRVDYFIVRD